MQNRNKLETSLENCELDTEMNNPYEGGGSGGSCDG